MSGAGRAEKWRHTRRSIRLPGYDYASPGIYFVSVCSYRRECLFGAIHGDQFDANGLGEAVVSAWLSLSQLYSFVKLDEFVLMPNHLHGLLVLRSDSEGGGSRTAPTFPERVPKSLGRIVGAFKTISTHRINETRGSSGKPLWQRNYYEHIVRDDDELYAIRRYIRENPAQWMLDEENLWHEKSRRRDIVGAVREPPHATSVSQSDGHRPRGKP